MDPLNIGTTIFNYGRKIKGALETVKDNKEMCSSIRETVETIGDILNSADNHTNIMAPGMCKSLRKLVNAMEKALNLIRDCQEKSRLGHLLTADQMSKKLQDANHSIIQSMEIVQFAMTSLQPAPSREDPYDSSRKEMKEGYYYSCSSSCSVSQLKAMIKDLSEENVIEQDGDYIMYKVTLSDGACAIVRRSARFGAVPSKDEHEIQVRGRAKLEHINILELLGYFFHEGFFYMVNAEYFEILSSCIYDNPSIQKELSWQWCSDIILDIAFGVVYLHDRGVIHMSLHPTRIGIDSECFAKISYFHISQILTQSVQEGMVTTLEMERGFAPPEYEHHGRFSVKTDVYSYGVLLLELITGQMCNQGDDNYNSLTASVWQHTLENNMRNCIQTQLINAADGPQIEDIKRCLHIALLCVEEDPALRPTMHDVLGWLRNNNQVLPWIYKPAYITKDTVTDNSRKEEKEGYYYSYSSSCSVSQLKAMIKDLSEEQITAQNGDYIMYKVKLGNGAYVIIYRTGRFGAAATTVKNEIRVRDMANLEHINLLELGYIFHEGFFDMVFAECSGTLSCYIYENPSTGNELSWQWCSDIILDIADGVAYLHDRGVIHMYLHPRNIIVSLECVAKISFFHISQILDQSDQDGVVTTLEMERGFAPPEYEQYGTFSVKTDVYSYGVLLLELITGQMCNQLGDNYNSLTVSVFQYSLANKMINCIQPRLINAADERQIEDIKRCIRIALLCVEEDPARRPTMHEVRWWLMNKNQDLPRISASWRTKAT